MDAESENFFEELESCPREGFKVSFGKAARRLGLNSVLKRSEVLRLYEAAFLAALCNISVNGLGACEGVKPEKEATRCRLEQAFMDACQNFYECDGWKVLTMLKKKSIQRAFLTVSVNEENLAH
jgi:hypothetical protein